MDDEAMNPTVTLNANVDPYVQGMNQAAEATKQSGSAISGLLDKMHQLNQSTAQKLQIVGAGTLASLTALALAADGANKQLNTLQASAAITGKNFGAFRDSVASISSSMPRSRDEIAQLETSISKLGITSQKQVDEFTKLFAKMGSATGGSPQVLADQMIKLSRTMGTLDTQSVNKFSNSLTYVSAKLGTSAEGAAQFANSIAPFTRAAGIGEAATLGLGAAFSKSGSDGMVAANTFAKITSDITNSLASGSPEIKKYAAALGMTVGEFKSMGQLESTVALFEKITTSAKSAGVLLESLGIEGPRTARQIQQAVAEAGGIRRAVGLADSGGANAIDVGSSAAEDNISDQFIKIKNASRATADALGEPLVGPLKAIARTMASVTQAGTTMAQIFAPLLKLVVPLAAAFLALGTAMKAMAAMQALATAAGMTARGALGGGLLAGMRSVTGAPQSAVGQMYAERMAPGFVPGPGQRQLTAYERGMYAAGRGVGNLREMLSGEGAGARSITRTGAIAGLKGVQWWNNWSGDFAKQMGTAGPQRSWTPAQNLINRYFPDSNLATQNLGSAGTPGAAGAPGMMAPMMGRATSFGSQVSRWWSSSPEERAASKIGMEQGQKEFGKLGKIQDYAVRKAADLRAQYSGDELDKKLKELEKKTQSQVDKMRDASNKQMAKIKLTMTEAEKVSAEAGKAVGAVGKNFGAWASVAGKDLMGLGKMASKILMSPIKMLGGPMVAITAGLVAWQQIKKAQEDDKKNAELAVGQSGLKNFYANIGQTSPNQTSLQDVLKSQEKGIAKNSSFSQATNVTGDESKQALTTGRKLTDSRFRKMTDQQMLAYLRINNFDLKNNPELLSQVANDITQATGSQDRANAILTAYANGAPSPGSVSTNSNLAASGQGPLNGSATANDYAARAQFYATESQGSWMNRNMWLGGVPQGLQDAVSQDITANQTTAGTVQSIYGGNTGVGVAAAGVNAQIGALPNTKPMFGGKLPSMLGGLGVDHSLDQQWVAVIKGYEKQFGIDPVGFNYASFANYASNNGYDMSTSSGVNQALAAYLRTKGKRGEALSTALYGSSGQYAGKNAGQIQLQLNNEISSFNPNDNPATKKKMDIVGKMTGNKSGGAIYASTLKGTSGAGVSSFAKSLAETGSEELRYAAGVEQANAAIQASNGDIKKAISTLAELAYNAGPNTQEASIYKTAQTLAGIEEQRKSMQVSPTENLKNTVKNAQNTLAISEDPAAKIAAKDTLVQSESTFRQILLSIINFNKSMARAEEDYLKQRGYAIEDFKKQKKYQIEDAAKTINNPYQPPQAQSTIGGAALLQNYTRGNSRIVDHLNNLKKLEKLGLSRATIQQLDLFNPANFQETVTLIDYLKSNPAKAAEFNKQTDLRIKNTGALMNSGFSDAFNRADKSFKTGMTRMEDSYNKTMSRAKTDFNDTMNGMTGNLETLFQKATSKASAGINALGAEAKKNLQSVFEDIYQVKVIVSKGGDTPKKTAGQAQTPTLKPVPTSSAPGARNPGAKGYADDPKNSGTVDSITNTSPVASYGFRNPPSPDWVKDNWMSLRSPSQPPKGENRDNGKWAYLGSRGNGTDWIWFDYDSFPQGAFDQKDGSGKPLQTPIQRAYGGQVDAGRSYVVGEKGPELLQGVSGHIMPSSSFQTSVARETVQMMRVAGFANQTTYKGGGVTNVDNSTKIMGGQFTVVTNDPDAMGRQLKGKERLDRLRTGKRTP